MLHFSMSAAEWTEFQEQQTTLITHLGALQMGLARILHRRFQGHAV